MCIRDRSWFPLSILQRSTAKSLVVDTSTFFTEYNAHSLEFVRTRLSEVLTCENSSRNRVLLTYNERKTSPIEIQELKDNDGTSIKQSVFNLGCLQVPTLEAIINKDRVTRGIYLDAYHHKDLIEHIYSALLFSTR